MCDRKSAKYTDLAAIYRECSGPGGLQVAELLAEKMALAPGYKLLDVGYNRGCQTCFLAREYEVDIVAIDPLDDIDTGLPNSVYLMQNAARFGVENRVLGVRTGVPDTRMPTGYFHRAYCTTTLEMLRGFLGEDFYLDSLREIHRVLRPGGILGLAEPMHLDTPVPPDLAQHLDRNGWDACFTTLERTCAAVEEAGFTVLEADHCARAEQWWREFVCHEPGVNPDDAAVVEKNRGRWLSFGYVIAQR